MTTQRAIPQYVLLALVLAPAIWIQAGYTSHLVALLQHAPDMPGLPFQVQAASRQIGTGPFRNYQVLALEGKPFNSPRELEDKVAAMRPGEPITVLMSEPTGQAVEKRFMLPQMAPKEGVDFTTAALWIMLDAGIPIFVLALGSFVVLMRPRDINAWLLLLLLLSFSEVVRDHRWNGTFAKLVFVWSAAGFSLWPASMMLFGLYFPERIPWEKRHPWAKYLILIPSLLSSVLYWAIVGLWQDSINQSEVWRGAFLNLNTLQKAISMVAISTFFFSIGWKSGSASSADARRRLRILWVGAAISLTPLLLVALYALFRRKDFFDGVPLVLIVPVLMLLVVFPLTLAYVIVIERAMDLQFVIRQSVQYGVLKVGVWLVRAILFAAGIYLLTNAGMYTSELRQAELAGVGVALILIRKPGADRLSRWVDRRFFREAYDAEHVLSELAGEVGQFLTLGPLLETVASRIQNTMHVPRVSVLLRQGTRLTLAYPPPTGQPVAIDADGALARLLTEPRTIDYDRPASWMASFTGEELQALDLMRSQLLLGLRGQHGLDGVLSLGPKLSEAPYSPSDIRLLQTVATQVALAVQNSRLAESLAEEAAHRERLNREVEIAREVQQRLFPQKHPPVAGMEYWGDCRPAQSVGGDYYDFIPLSNGKLGVAIGDVSGKGIAAALLMASLQASLRGQTIVDLQNLSQLMRNVNKLIYEASTRNRFATLFYGEYDPATRTLTYVNAGHNSPAILRGSELIRLTPGGPGIGLVSSARFQQGSIQLQPADTLVAFTDGLSEAMNSAQEEWEEPRFLAAAQACKALTPREIITHLFRAADAFADGADQHDDMTLIVAKF